MTDYKQLCAEFVGAVDRLLSQGESPANPGQRLILTVHVEDLGALADCARAALEEPEPEGPMDEEIMDLMPQQMRDDLAAAARAMSGFDPDNIKAASVFRIILNRHSVDHARAVLARWGRPAPAPADGEVAELVKWLRATAETLHEGSIQTPRLTRAADLLERMAPQPIPVTERLPKAEDCDAEGRGWSGRLVFPASR